MNNGFSNESNQNTLYVNEGSQYETLSGYINKTFLWMFGGLMATFIVAYWAYASDLALYFLTGSWGLLIGLTVVEFAIVIFLGSRLQTMKVSTARLMFFAYAIINGIVFSSYFWMYDMQSLVMAFGATALYFGIMAAYGHFTKQDLSGWGKPLLFGLIAILIVSIVGMFLRMPGLDIVLSCVGIVIFACYTAYDTQKLKSIYFATTGDPEMAKKASIYGALALYLDFINLFLFILRLVARRSRN